MPGILNPTAPYPANVGSSRPIGGGQGSSYSKAGAQILNIDDFRNPQIGFTNYGAAACYTARDNEVPCNGLPSMRIVVPQGTTTGQTTPTLTDDAAGAIIYRHLVGALPTFGIYSLEFYLRFGFSINTNAIFSTSLFTRDGVNNHLGRIWFNTGTAGQIDLQCVTGGAYSTIANMPMNPSGAIPYLTPPIDYPYDPSSANIELDKAGRWMFCRLVVDFTGNQYVLCQFNEVTINMLGTPLNTAADSGTKALHYGWTLASKVTSNRYVHIAQAVISREG